MKTQEVRGLFMVLVVAFGIVVHIFPLSKRCSLKVKRRESNASMCSKCQIIHIVTILEDAQINPLELGLNLQKAEVLRSGCVHLPNGPHQSSLVAVPRSSGYGHFGALLCF